jgi:diadenosine tetraphosphate (Ap4A) HIT family hydrolase
MTSDFLGNQWQFDCMGCAVSSGAMLVPGGMIHRTQHFCVHQDPLIPLPGFLVIGSNRHIRSIGEMQPAEYDQFAMLLKVTHQAIRAGTGVEHLTIIQEESSIHFHLWFFPWTQSVVAQYGSASLDKIRAIMSDYRAQAIVDAEWMQLQETIEAIKSFYTKLLQKEKG